jgi:addiction module RelE/StbE family toxin
MEIVFQKKFKKKLKKLPPKIQDQFYERLEVFILDKNHKILNNHSVDKMFTDCRSLNVTGDYRAIFKEDNNVAVFLNIGTHSELY